MAGVDGGFFRRKAYASKRRRAFYLIALTLLLAAALVAPNYTAKFLFPLKYREHVLKYSDINGLDPFLVFAVIKAESGFNPRAVSGKNARGLMQIAEKTGEWAAKKLMLENYTPDSLYDPETNIRIGCWYIGVLMKEFGNNADLILAAYNGGSGNVSGWLKNKDYSDTGDRLDRIPFKETEDFVKRVKNYYSVYKNLYANERLKSGP